MISESLFWILACSCFYYIFRCYYDPSRLYQFPALSAVAVIVILLPTLFFIKGEERALLSDDYNRFVLNAILCFWAGILGHTLAISKFNRGEKMANTPYFVNYTSIINKIIPYVIIGGIASFMMPASQFGNETTSGIFAILVYFARLLRPSAIILLCLYLIKPKPLTLLLFLVWFIFFFFFLIISGRRSEFFTIALVLSLPYYFIKKITVNKNYIIPGVITGILIFILLPIVRPYMKSGDYSQISNVSLKPVVDGYISGEKPNEIIHAALNMRAVKESGEYGYGLSTVINGLIYQYASATIFGTKFKESLMLRKVDIEMLRFKYGGPLDQGFRYYLTPTGYGSSYTEFGFWGCLTYFLFAYISGVYYKKAMTIKEFKYIILYCFIAVMSLFSVYDSITAVISTYLPPYMLVFYHVIYFNNSKPKKLNYL